MTISMSNSQKLGRLSCAVATRHEALRNQMSLVSYVLLHQVPHRLARVEGGTGKQHNARQTTMTGRTNTATSVSTSMLSPGTLQAGTMATSGTNNEVSNRPQQTGELSARLISAQ